MTVDKFHWRSSLPTTDEVTRWQWWFHRDFTGDLYVFNLDTEDGVVYDHSDGGSEPPVLLEGDWPGEWAPALNPDDVKELDAQLSDARVQLGISLRHCHELQDELERAHHAAKAWEEIAEATRGDCRELNERVDCLRSEHASLLTNYNTLLGHKSILESQNYTLQGVVSMMVDCLAEGFVRRTFGDTVDFAPGTVGSKIAQMLSEPMKKLLESVSFKESP